MIKACVFDLDHTILPSGKVMLSDRLCKIINKLKEKNVSIVLNTSRAKDEFSLFDKDLVNCFDALIYSTGALIEVNNKVVYADYLKYEDVKDIEEYAYNNNIVTAYSDKNHSFYFNKELNANHRLDLNSYFSNGFKVKSVKELNEIMDYYIFDCLEHSAALAAINPDKLEVYVMAELAIRSKHINKGSGLLKYCELYNLKEEECMVFGDGDNDISMFILNTQAIAMGNASANLKAVANEICDTDINDGVAKRLEELYNRMYKVYLGGDNDTN